MILSSASLSGVTAKPSIVEAIDFELGTDSTSYPLADKLRNINRWLLKAGLWIWKASSTWKFDDSNATTLPYGTDNLVANQRDYGLPTSVISVEMVQVKDAGGNWKTLERRDMEQFPDAIDNDSAGMPQYWDMEGRSIILFPKPSAADVTLSEGLRVFLSRQMTKFTISDAGVEAGFEEQFHDTLIFGPCYDFCRAKNIFDKASVYKTELESQKADITDFYPERDSATTPRVKRKFVSYS